MNLTRYYHTVRHLRFSQAYGRIAFRLLRPKPQLGPAPPLRAPTRSWVKSCERPPSMIEADRFAFLNVKASVSTHLDWNRSDLGKLWLYNLHYFDDLNAVDASARAMWHQELISRWIGENPPARGVGWDPYPSSLRIVNWIKWHLSGCSLANSAIDSLVIQVRLLSKRVEAHLLGNHLIANAKALVFAGLFFDGPEADRWLDYGLRLLSREISEQILQDGGHFERSPMYHALILEDLLDLENILRVFGHKASGLWLDVIQQMRLWLHSMVHPDGDIAFFNDAAMGVAPSLEGIESYADRLRLPTVRPELGQVTHLVASGYVRLELDPAVAFLDVAPVGPDYLPAHAHADTLSFELSLFGERVLVNSGTAIYEAGPERDRQRGTAAHNTVVVDGENSSEVWGAFRVARRARISNAAVQWFPEISVRAAHDGYGRLRGRPIHRREWSLHRNQLVVTDKLDGAEQHRVEVVFHVHPNVAVTSSDSCAFTIKGARLRGSVSLRIEGQVVCELGASTYHPEFGMSVANSRLCARYEGLLPVQIRTVIEWQPL